MMKQLAIDEAEADAWGNAQEVNRLRDECNRLRKERSLLLTKIKRQHDRDARYRANRQWWAEQNADFDRTNDEEHPR